MSLETVRLARQRLAEVHRLEREVRETQESLIPPVLAPTQWGGWSLATLLVPFIGIPLYIWARVAEGRRNRAHFAQSLERYKHAVAHNRLPELQQRLQTAVAALKESHLYIHPTYVKKGPLKRFEHYLVTGRAETLKECMNLYEQEVRVERLIEEQEYQNELLSEQIAQAEELEKAVAKQTAQVARQTEATQSTNEKLTRIEQRLER